MGDLELHYEQLETAYDEFIQAARAMEDNLHQLTVVVDQNREYFLGSAAEQFNQFHTVLSSNEDAMHQDIVQGAQALQTMYENQKYADKAAAAGFGGGTHGPDR